MEFLYEYGLFGLFLASFLAATILPFSSEAFLSLLLANGFATEKCIAAATFGNWLGGMSSYYLGYLGKWSWIEKYLRIKKQALKNGTNACIKKVLFLHFLAGCQSLEMFLPLALGYFVPIG